VRYTVTIGVHEFEVLVNGAEVSVNGRRVSARLTSIPDTPIRQLMVGNRSHCYVIVDGEESWAVSRGGEITEVAVEDERARRLRDVSGGRARTLSGGVVVAPMPGLVLRVEVQQGQQIGPGTGVVVLEAMKMENEISAVSGGVVTKIHVKAGQAVEKGARLVEVSPQG